MPETETFQQAAERIYHDWDKALSEDDDDAQVAARKPPLRTHYRTGFLTDGNRTMIFEYPRATPDGEQMDFVEVMEIADGLIQRHCVYWRWRGVKVIQDDAYHK